MIRDWCQIDGLLGLLLRCISLCCSNKHATCVGDRSTAHSRHAATSIWYDRSGMTSWKARKADLHRSDIPAFTPTTCSRTAAIISATRRGKIQWLCGPRSPRSSMGLVAEGIPSWIWHFPAGVQLPARPGHSGEDFRTADSWPMASIVRDRDLEDVERTCTQVGMGQNPGTPMSIPKMNRIVFTHVGGDNIDPWPHRPWIILSKRTGFQWQLRYGPEEDFPYWPNCGATYLGFSWLQLAFRTGPASRWQGWHRCNHRASKTIDY